MRVALVHGAFLQRTGGMDARVRDLALALCAAGFDAHVVTTHRGVADGGDVPAHRVSASPPFAALNRLLRDEQFDVVHAHVAGLSPTAYAAAIGGTRAGLASVLTFHSMLDRTSALVRASESLFGWSRRIVLTGVSSVVAAQAARALSGASVGVLPHGIDTRVWRGAARKDCSVEIRFVSALELSRTKDAESLVRAFAAAVRFVAGSPSLRLTIAGDGARRMRVSRLAAELGVGSRVDLVGHLDRNELRGLHARSDAFVLPGEREPFGIAALEARAGGLPVIAMLASGARDFITHGVHGLLARNETELAQFISRLALDEPLRCFITNRNLTELPPYDWELVVRMHRAIYEAAVALRDTPAPAIQM